MTTAINVFSTYDVCYKWIGGSITNGYTVGRLAAAGCINACSMGLGDDHIAMRVPCDATMCCNYDFTFAPDSISVSTNNPTCMDTSTIALGDVGSYTIPNCGITVDYVIDYLGTCGAYCSLDDPKYNKAAFEVLEDKNSAFDYTIKGDYLNLSSKTIEGLKAYYIFDLSGKNVQYQIDNVGEQIDISRIPRNQNYIIKFLQHSGKTITIKANLK
ncbi:MAG: T9SS type A sorting domain-containing protein [Chitinophagaceae bacterium]|jgi:hypothetical protein|nr:T9SS type A sorting domain-containing protein [Chitinophagaceae bacterium]